MTSAFPSMTPDEYLASLPFDKRLALYDIRGSIAHARMLAHVGVLTKQEMEQIVRGLEAVRADVEKGDFPFASATGAAWDKEDVHMNIEGRLIELIGPVGGKLHTARSRNDQVALDTRLFLKDAIAETDRRLTAYQTALLDLADANQETILPGYTHLQRAQPVLLAHHLLAYVEMAHRDRERMADCLVRTDVLPLGAGALAGVPYPIDREFVAKELGFTEIARNSMDAVSDRDFIVDFEEAASLAMVHLSRLAEEIIIWSSEEFGFVRAGDAYTSGSSIMPQKRNPDIAELARGKTGRVIGHMVAMLTTLKGLPLAYNRDMQEDKEGLFDTVDTLLSTLEMMTGMVASLQVNRGRMLNAAQEGFLLATDVADYLVSKGAPFREAHGIVQRLSQYGAEKGKMLRDFTLDEYRRFSDRFDQDVLLISAASSVAARSSHGGTSGERVAAALKEARKRVDFYSAVINNL